MLGAISAIASDDIWAIGNHGIASIDHRPFIVHWNGSDWSVFEPRPAPLYRGTSDIAAISPEDVWVSAEKSDGTLFGRIPVFLHWDGSTWTEFDSPGGRNLTAIAADDVWAADERAISHWDGHEWTLVAATDPFTENRILSDVVALGPCDVRGVGWSGVADEQRTMSMTLTSGAATSVLPDAFPGSGKVLLGAFPNPFRPQTTLSWELPVAPDVRLTIFDVAGRQVARLVDERQGAGLHTAAWNGRDERGAPIGPGTYFARLESGELITTRKIVLSR